MSTIITATTGPDGTLHLELPGHQPGIRYEVRCFTQPAKATECTPEEWKAVVLSLAGSITDPTFERPLQLPLEDREPLS
jgi:hypothetical protein